MASRRAEEACWSETSNDKCHSTKRGHAQALPSLRTNCLPWVLHQCDRAILATHRSPNSSQFPKTDWPGSGHQYAPVASYLQARAISHEDDWTRAADTRKCAMQKAYQKW